MAKNRRWWMIVLAIITTALLTGCFRSTPKIPLNPFLTLIAPYPGATEVHPDSLSLFWEVDFREVDLPQNEEAFASRENPVIWYLVYFTQGNEDFGSPEVLQGGKNVFFRLDPDDLEFETEYRWKIAALFADGHIIVSEEATFTTGPQRLLSHRPPDTVRVQSGTFQMGDEVGDLWGTCRPVHTVTLTYDYWIGKYEVTFDQYDAFCNATGRRMPGDEGWGRGTRPAIYVSWWDAIAYCNWLSDQNGLAPAYDRNGILLDKKGQITQDISQVEGFRLPTEAEWEYAASGGHKALPIPPRFLYAGSDDIYAVALWFGNNVWYWPQTRQVGEMDPNELGLHDMSGNVWEWCHDRVEWYSGAAKTNPIGPSTGVSRIARGGSWKVDVAMACRVAVRDSEAAAFKRNDLGFRIARTDF